MSDSSTAGSADVDRLDTATSRLGQKQTEALKLLLELAEKHQQLDEEYAPRVNGLLREIQDDFNHIRLLAQQLQGAILPKDRRSAARLSGKHAWRSFTAVKYEASEDELVARIKAMGQGVSRRLLRTVPSRVLDKSACNLSTNLELVGSVEGMSVLQGESYSVTPSGGFAMTTTRDITKLEGLPLPKVLEVLLRDPEA